MNRGFPPDTHQLQFFLKFIFLLGFSLVTLQVFVPFVPLVYLFQIRWPTDLDGVNVGSFLEQK